MVEGSLSKLADMDRLSDNANNCVFMLVGYMSLSVLYGYVFE